MSEHTADYDAPSRHTHPGPCPPLSTTWHCPTCGNLNPHGYGWADHFHAPIPPGVGA